MLQATQLQAQLDSTVASVYMLQATQLQAQLDSTVASVYMLQATQLQAQLDSTVAELNATQNKCEELEKSVYELISCFLSATHN